MNSKKYLLFIFFHLLITGSVQANIKKSDLDQTPKDEWIAIDKLQHLSYSILVSLGCQYVLVNKLNYKEKEALTISSILSFSAGLAKEIQDKKSSYFSKKDMIANFIGISMGMLIINIP
jgi:uncharacterized protein YfiM (DUF2279 family)